jgi:hypothetical protein
MRRAGGRVKAQTSVLTSLGERAKSGKLAYMDPRLLWIPQPGNCSRFLVVTVDCVVSVAIIGYSHAVPQQSTTLESLQGHLEWILPSTVSGE